MSGARLIYPSSPSDSISVCSRRHATVGREIRRQSELEDQETIDLVSGERSAWRGPRRLARRGV